MDRLFHREGPEPLPETDLLALFDHIDRCEACRREYNRRTYEERRDLSPGGEDEPSYNELQRVLQLVIAGCAENTSLAETPPRRPWLEVAAATGAAALLAAGAAAAVVFLL